MSQADPLPFIRCFIEYRSALASKNLARIEINPEQNNGVSYAYQEVVRNKEARKQMHGVGCDCCKGVSRCGLVKEGGACAEDDVAISSVLRTRSQTPAGRREGGGHPAAHTRFLQAPTVLGGRTDTSTILVSLDVTGLGARCPLTVPFFRCHSCVDVSSGTWASLRRSRSKKLEARPSDWSARREKS